MESTCAYWSSASDDQYHSHVPRWYAGSRDLFNTVFAAVIMVVLQRFVEDPLIVSDLVYLDDAPKGEDSRPREEGTLDVFGE